MWDHRIFMYGIDIHSDIIKSYNYLYRLSMWKNEYICISYKYLVINDYIYIYIYISSNVSIYGDFKFDLIGLSKKFINYLYRNIQKIILKQFTDMYKWQEYTIICL